LRFCDIFIKKVDKININNPFAGNDKNIDIPEDLRVDELDEYKQMKLKELRKWIFRQRGGKVKHDVIDAFKKVFVNSPPPQTAG